MPAPTALPIPAFHPFVGRDLPWLVDAQATQRAGEEFLIWESFTAPSQSWTFAAFAARTRAFAAGLAAHGISRGDHVALHLDNCPDFLFLWVALSRLGAVAVTTNTASTSSELDYFLSHSGSVAAITQPKYLHVLRQAGATLRWMACTESDFDESSTALRPADILSVEALCGNPAEAPSRPAEPLLRNNVIYTSGTTSRPKGVVWTHANALWIASITARHYELTSQDTQPVYLPLFHTNALGLSFLGTLWAGGRIVLQPRFSASRFWDIAERHRCTWAQMILFTLRVLLEKPDPPRHHFRFWAAAGDMRLVRDRWGIKTVGIYGMTETIGLCISSDLRFVGAEGAMGRPRPEYEVTLRDARGATPAPRQPGSLWVRGIPGLSLFLEYLNDPQATAAAFDANGWMETGDTAMSLDSGDWFFTGRARDALKVGGENVAALEIETVISAVPGVAECAVVGKEDPLLEEVPVAFVATAAPSAELEAKILAACARGLSEFKHPREIRFVDALPKGVLDKILKNELRDLLRREASMAQAENPS